MCVLKVKVISLPYIFKVLYVLCFTEPRYQVSVYRTIGPLVLNLDLQKTRIFLKTHTKRLMFHTRHFAFVVLEPIFVGGVFQNILTFCNC